MKLRPYRLLRLNDIRPLSDGYEEYPALAVDLETVRGKPHTIQFFDGESAELIYVNSSNITDTFLDGIEKRFKPHLVVWFFNLSHDLPLLFPKLWSAFADSCEFSAEAGAHHLYMVCDRVWFANGNFRGRPWYLRDAMLFVHSSLSSACEDFALPVKKLPHPAGLGERRLSGPSFERYAIEDARATWHLGRWIMRQYERQDVPLGVSLSDFTGKVWRKHFFPKGERIRLPEREILHASLRAYHGGKTETYIDAPCRVNRVQEFDIVSAYPSVMHDLPNFIGGSYCYVTRFKSPVGIYQARGVSRCPYACLYDEQFKPVVGSFSGWFSGFEIEAGLSHGCLSLNEARGFIYRPAPRDSHGANPLRGFVMAFYRQKAESKTASDRLLAKLMLNSLYGKYVARVILKGDDRELWRCGSLFHPFLGCLITGALRARLHALEHRYRPVHVSTDSLILRESGSLPVEQNRLGGLVKKAEGDLVLLRRKLYLILNGQRIVKWAGHGFWGTANDLLRMYRERATSYTAQHMWGLREALLRKDGEAIPFRMERVRRSLKISWKGYKVFS